MKKCLILIIFWLSSVCLYSQFAGGDGTEQNPYLIATAEQLDTMRYYVSLYDKYLYTHFRLVADIDLGVPPWNEGEGWSPIGFTYTLDSSDYGFFTSYFHGGGYKIKNLYINRPFTNHQGLFGYYVNTVIDSVEIENCNIIGQDGVGGLVGKAEMGDWTGRPRKITNCKMSGKIVGRDNVGGLIGNTHGHHLIRNCYVKNAHIIANGNGFVGGTAGGIIGSNRRDSIVECSFDGIVEAKINGSAGGITSFNEVCISKCYSTGIVKSECNVSGICVTASNASQCYSNCNIHSEYYKRIWTGEEGYVGLLFGLVQTDWDNFQGIIDCYSTGKFIPESDTCKNIGLIGMAESAIIRNCYSLGSFNGLSKIGGIAGYASFSAPTVLSIRIENCVAINDELNGIAEIVNRIVGQEVFFGGMYPPLLNNYALDEMKVNGFRRYSNDVSSLDGKDVSSNVLLTQEFYENTLGWNFDSVWKMCENCKYPILQWQDCVECPTAIREDKKVNVMQFPNPVATEISITFGLDRTEKVRIDLLDLEGKTIDNIYDGIEGAGIFIKTYSLNKLASASYLLKIKIGDKIQIEKFVKK